MKSLHDYKIGYDHPNFNRIKALVESWERDGFQINWTPNQKKERKGAKMKLIVTDEIGTVQAVTKLELNGQETINLINVLKELESLAFYGGKQASLIFEIPKEKGISRVGAAFAFAFEIKKIRLPDSRDINVGFRCVRTKIEED